MGDEKIEKKISIFDLYQESKSIKIVDDEKKEIELMVTRPTAYQKKLTDDLFNDIYNKKIEESKGKREFFKADLKKNSSKDDIIKEFMNYDKSVMEGNQDLIDINNEETLTKEEKDAKIAEATEKWTKHRIDFLKQKSEGDLINMMVEFLINGTAFTEASKDKLIYELTLVVKDPITKEKIFSEKPEDANYILNCDERVIEQIAKQYNATKISQQDVRKVTEEGDFLPIMQ